MLLFVIVCSSLLFACYFAVEAMKVGLCEKRWFAIGVCFGPLLLPMFNMHKRVKFRQLQVAQKAIVVAF